MKQSKQYSAHNNSNLKYLFQCLLSFVCASEPYFIFFCGLWLEKKSLNSTTLEKLQCMWEEVDLHILTFLPFRP